MVDNGDEGGEVAVERHFTLVVAEACAGHDVGHETEGLEDVVGNDA